MGLRSASFCTWSTKKEHLTAHLPPPPKKQNKTSICETLMEVGSWGLERWNGLRVPVVVHNGNGCVEEIVCCVVACMLLRYTFGCSFSWGGCVKFGGWVNRSPLVIQV